LTGARSFLRQAKEDWAIIRALSAEAGHTLPYDTLAALRAAMYQAAPQLARIGAVHAASRDGVEALAKKGSPITQEPFASPISDFYLTNPIARASTVMAEMSALKKSMTRPRVSRQRVSRAHERERGRSGGLAFVA
jgi:NADH-quinone oxidoreductase subunit G